VRNSGELRKWPKLRPNNPDAAFLRKDNPFTVFKVPDLLAFHGGRSDGCGVPGWTEARKENTTMKTFILDADHNITAYASQQQAGSAVPQGDAFTTVAGLKTALKKYSAATAVEIWNSLAGVTPVKKFKDAATAANRIFEELQKLRVPDAEAAPANTDAPKNKRQTRGAAKPAAGGKGTKKAAKGTADEPRAVSKTSRLIEMLKRPQGATLEEVMAEFGWQVHSTRAIMSAGGSLTKKHGITVISEKIGDSRTYRITK
jgi:hypothetical protein